ncbi:MAG: Phytanoyl-CoA dioxygenase [Hyphomonadaceae bacterium]|nr:MAG: Phytanoyl-CoA dioxygenase [Hyphomonadaceae bacterium]
MNTELSNDQISYYQENGFLIYRSFLNAEEIVDLKEAVLEAIATMGRNRISGENVHLKDGDAYFDRVYTQRLNLWVINELKNPLPIPQICTWIILIGPFIPKMPLQFGLHLKMQRPKMVAFVSCRKAKKSPPLKMSARVKNLVRF